MNRQRKEAVRFVPLFCPPSLSRGVRGGVQPGWRAGDALHCWALSCCCVCSEEGGEERLVSWSQNTDAISRRSQMSFLLSLLFSINISLDFFKPRAKERKKFNERCVACCGWELTPAAQ